MQKWSQANFNLVYGLVISFVSCTSLWNLSLKLVGVYCLRFVTKKNIFVGVSGPSYSGTEHFVIHRLCLSETVCHCCWPV